MMILSDFEIKKNLGEKIIIDPFDIKQLNPNTYNLRFFDKLVIYKEKILDMKKANV